MTRDLTVPGPVSDATQIRKAAGNAWPRVTLGKRIRLLGVRARYCRQQKKGARRAGAGQFVW